MGGMDLSVHLKISDSITAEGQHHGSIGGISAQALELHRINFIERLESVEDKDSVGNFCERSISIRQLLKEVREQTVFGRQAVRYDMLMEKAGRKE